MRKSTLALAAVTALLGLSASHSAQAQLVINSTFDNTWASDPFAAADQASILNMIATNFTSKFTNPITVNVDFSSVNFGLGTTYGSYYNTSYNTYQTDLTNVKQIANGGDGNTAFLAELPSSGNPVPGNSTSGVTITAAQGRLLGLGTAGTATAGHDVNGNSVDVGENGKTFDANIELKTADFQPYDPITNPEGGYSAAGVAAHELDEVLGINSDLNSLAVAPGTQVLEDVGSMDFYRYSAPGVRVFTTDTTVASYFSDDGGVTPIVYFNMQSTGDRHDWASDGEAYDAPLPQVQDAFSTPSTPTNPVTSNLNLGPSEYRALNDIGYNLKPQGTTTPEPAAVVPFAFGGLGLLGLMLRARKRKTQS